MVLSDVGINIGRKGSGNLAKLNIALLCNGLGIVDRGSETLTKEIYKHLKNDFEIDMFSAKNTGTKNRNQIKIPWRNGKAYLESYYFCRYLYKKHMLDNYNIIINNAGFPGSYWCRKQRKRNKTPFITLERGGGKEELLNYLFKPDYMIYLTETSENNNNKKRYLPKIKTTTIPIGINIEEFKDKSKSKLVDGLEHPIILSTSALVSFKRIDLIINALEYYGKGSLIQTSDGNMQKEWVELGKQKLGSRFKYVGRINRKKLLKLYNSCDIFVNASGSEAFGIVYLEAMASELPIITQDDRRRREIIGEAGFFIDCESKHQFINAIKNVHTTKKHSLEQAKKFSWDKIKTRYIDVIEEVAISKH